MWSVDIRGLSLQPEEVLPAWYVDGGYIVRVRDDPCKEGERQTKGVAIAL